MGRALALCLLPALLACLALALAFEALTGGLGWPCVLCLTASGVLFALGCARMIGASMYGSFRRELERRGDGGRLLSPEDVAGRRRRAWALSGAGALLLALGFVLGGEPLLSVLRFLLSL